MNRDVAEAYRHSPRTERCACGGIITALPWTIMVRLREHQETERHLLWRQREGL